MIIMDSKPQEHQRDKPSMRHKADLKRQRNTAGGHISALYGDTHICHVCHVLKSSEIFFFNGLRCDLSSLLIIRVQPLTTPFAKAPETQ